MRRRQRWTALVVAGLMVAAAGCDRDDEPVEPVATDHYEAVEGLDEDPAEADQADETDQPDQVDQGDEVEQQEDEQALDDPRREIADDADQALRQRLMGRVMEVAQEDGFPAAVDVCHDEAEPLTEQVGQEYDVEIGRVADRLRNPDNVGDDWVWEMIEDADGEPHYEADDELRAVKPIELAQPCVNCHGETDELAEGVPEAIAAHYPEDEATGYEVGDLRGWVWVQVPEQ